MKPTLTAKGAKDAKESAEVSLFLGLRFVVFWLIGE